MPHPPEQGWHRRVWALAFPIILANLSVPLVGMVDTAVVGHLPDPRYIGAVALGSVVFNLVFWSFGFLRMGSTGFMARAVGQGDPVEAQATVLRSLALAVLIGLVLLALKSPIASIALDTLDADPGLRTLAAGYLEIRMWSAPATLALHAVIGCLIGLGDTRRVLALQLILNSLNAGLDVLFVLGLGLNVDGVALASVLAEWTAASCGVYWLWRKLPRTVAIELRSVFSRSALVGMMAVNADIFIRTACLLLVLFHFTRMGARQGEVVLAANAILMHFQHLLSFGLDGFAHAVEALAGPAYARGERERFRQATRACLLWALVIAIGYGVVFAVTGALIIDLMTGIDPVRTAARDYLPWLVITPFVSVWSFHLDGVFVATLRAREMRNAMLASTAVYALAVYTLPAVLGNHGLWLAFMVFMVARAATLLLAYPRLMAPLRTS